MSEHARPAILAVDDEPAVARAVERDLRRRYGSDYRVLRAESGPAGLELLERIEQRGDPVAMIISDQRMPDVEGLELLRSSLESAPGAKRVLLTAYADTEAAITAINEVRLDHYLLKPWDPPEERLYPVIDDLLSDWKAGYTLPDDEVEVIGDRWQVEAYELRDFLARNFVPYRMHEADGQPALPVVRLPGGEELVRPTTRELADRLSIQTRPDHPFYDLVIIGGGPAGLAAAVYGASEGLRTVLVDRDAPGGQASQSSRIENYLGFPVGLSGADLTRRAVAQARRFGAELLAVRCAARIERQGPARIVVCEDESTLEGHAILLATGVEYRTLDQPGTRELTGRGIYYGAARSEAESCRDEQVIVIGGANSAGQAALNLAEKAAGVTLLYRGADLGKGMSHYLVERIEQHPSIDVRLQTELVEARGEDALESVVVRTTDGEEDELPATAVFVFIGARPNTDWLDGIVARDPRGFVLTGPEARVAEAAPRWPLERPPLLLETTLPGVFAAGDVRSDSVKRVASGVGDGSMSVQFVHRYLAGLAS